MDKAQFLKEKSLLRAEFMVVLQKHLPLSHPKDAWSPLEAFQHVLLTNQSAYSLLGRLLEKAKNLEGNPPAGWPVRADLREFPQYKAFSIPAFPGTEPSPSATRTELDELAARLDDRLQELLALTDRFNLAGLSFPHPLAGRLNFHEWLVFGLVHERLHLDRLLLDLGPA